MRKIILIIFMIIGFAEANQAFARNPAVLPIVEIETDGVPNHPVISNNQVQHLTGIRKQKSPIDEALEQETSGISLFPFLILLGMMVIPLGIRFFSFKKLEDEFVDHMNRERLINFPKDKKQDQKNDDDNDSFKKAG